MEDAYIVNGGKKLSGSVTLSGAKNVALKAIIASLLFESEVTLKNVPKINDVIELLHLITLLGARAEFIDEYTVIIDPTTMKENKVDMLHGSKIRVSFMLFAPLLHKFTTCYVPNPGGCRIGARPIDRIIEGMEKLGVNVTYDSNTGYYEAILNEINGEYHFVKPTHTGTELLIMLAARSRNTVTLHNVAFEPEIDELISFLNEGGANIKRHENQIIIEGVESLNQKQPFTIVEDRNEAVTFAVLAIASKGDITIENIDEQLIARFVVAMEDAGAGIERLGKGGIRFYYKGDVRPVDIETAPQPGFMTDWQPNWTVLMTQAIGDSIVHERVFENRLAFVNELKKLGAKIDFITTDIREPETFYHFAYDKKKQYQQAISVHGPTQLHSGILSVNDLRAGASLIIAALIANGQSHIKGASIVERGYENLVSKIQKLGGDIAKI